MISLNIHPEVQIRLDKFTSAVFLIDFELVNTATVEITIIL